jgi:hypothetical protein
MLLIPGINVAALATTAIVGGVAAMTMAMLESEFRIQAAADASSSEEFQEETEKAAVAMTNFWGGAAMMTFGFVLKILAKTPILGRMQTVGGALKAARTELVRITGVGPAFEALRASLLSKLRGARDGLPGLLGDLKGSLQLAKTVEGVPAVELFERLAKGDAALADLGFDKARAAQVVELSKTPGGANLAEGLKAQMVEALKLSPAEATRYVKDFASNLDKAIAQIDAAKDPGALSKALDAADDALSTEGQAVTADATVKRVGVDLAEAHDVKLVRAEQLKEVAELLKKPEGSKGDRETVIYKLRTPSTATGRGALEGYIPRSALLDNQAAIKKLAAELTASKPDVIVGMERGGWFLAETLKAADSSLAPKVVRMEVTKGVIPPGKKSGPKFAPEQVERFQKLVDAGAKKIAIVDYYMGGTTASALRDMLVKRFAGKGVVFEIHWVREMYGLSFDAAGKAIPMRGTIGPKEKGFGTVTQRAPHEVKYVIGDDVELVMQDSSAPLHVFDDAGTVVKTVEPKPGQTTRQALIDLLVKGL